MSDGEILPEILAGPILRRAEPSCVCVWIATKRRMQVTGFVYDAATSTELGRSEETISLSFGANLFVTLVQIKPVSVEKSAMPPPRFPNRVLLAYDLVLTPITKEKAD